MFFFTLLTLNVFSQEIPTMTSNTSPSGIASASSSYSSSYYPWKAFDGEDESGTDSRWISYPTGTYASQWISYEFESTVTISGYSIVPEIGGCVDRSPNTWYFQGYDGSSWVSLDYRTGYTISDWETDYDRQFIIKDPQSYSKYRLYVTAVNGSDVVSIRKLRMHESSDDMLKSTEEFSPFAINQESKLNFTNNKLAIYPNPNNGIFTVLLKNDDSEATTIQVLNINGQVVYSENATNNSFELQLNDLGKGIYFLRAKQNDVTETQKFIIE